MYIYIYIYIYITNTQIAPLGARAGHDRRREPTCALGAVSRRRPSLSHLVRTPSEIPKHRRCSRPPEEITVSEAVIIVIAIVIVI